METSVLDARMINFLKEEEEEFGFGYHDDDPYFKGQVADEGRVAITALGNVIAQIRNNLRNVDEASLRSFETAYEEMKRRYPAVIEGNLA